MFSQKLVRHLFSVYLFSAISCQPSSDNMTVFNKRLYKNSPAWKLSVAVKDGDTADIRKIINDDITLLNFQENRYGTSILEWAIIIDNFPSTKALVELGADPNLQSNSGSSALTEAADKYETSEYLRLLLNHGGDPNSTPKNSQEPVITPLIAASANRLESVKLLVDAGADVDYMMNYQSALKSACVLSRIEIIHYLIVQEKANFKRAVGYNIDGDSIYVKSWIEEMEFESNPSEESLRRDVLKYIQENGG